MAVNDKRISELPLKESLTGEELVEIVSDGANYAVKAEKIGGAASETYTATITTNWTGTTAPFTQTIPIDGILETDTPIVDVVLSTDTETARLQENAWLMISKIITGNDSITITCLEKRPTVEIPIQMKVVR